MVLLPDQKLLIEDLRTKLHLALQSAVNAGYGNTLRSSGNDPVAVKLQMSEETALSLVRGLNSILANG